MAVRSDTLRFPVLPQPSHVPSGHLFVTVHCACCGDDAGWDDAMTVDTGAGFASGVFHAAITIPYLDYSNNHAIADLGICREFNQSKRMTTWPTSNV